MAVGYLKVIIGMAEQREQTELPPVQRTLLIKDSRPSKESPLKWRRLTLVSGPLKWGEVQSVPILPLYNNS